ncbi:MAG: ATP-dependent Clp protease proteolytic subunit [Candidatus Lloydbacteria bacterium]|nr:ATP-dependent Clp protease proteolytic subunit [Candidatus Lloydbacteria bacterium]
MPRKNHQPDDDFEDIEEYSKLDDEKFEAALLGRRIALLTGKITEEGAGKLKGDLIGLSLQSPEKEIILFINSPGGDMDPGLALYDLITLYLKAPVIGVVGAECDSAALFVLQGCSKRIAATHSTFLIHPVRNEGARFVYNPSMIDDFIMEIRDKLKGASQICNDILKKHSKMSLAEIKQLSFANHGTGTTLSAPEALKKGLIDEIAKGDKYKIF